MPINCSINFFINTRFAFLFWTLITVYFPYRSPIILLSFSYHSPIVLLSFSYWGCGNNTETIRDWYGNNTESNGGWTNEERWNKGGSSYFYRKFLRQWQDSNKLFGCQNTIKPCSFFRVLNTFHHVEIQSINTRQIAAFLGWKRKWQMTSDTLNIW